MLRRSLSSGLALLAVAGVAAVALARGDEPAERGPQPAAEPSRTPAPTPAPAPAATPPPERVLVLVRRRDGLPAPWIRRLRRSRAVDALAEVSRTQWLLRRSTRAGGRVVTAPRAGYAIPLDVHVVAPRAYARVTREPVLRRLRAGRVLLSESSARLRRVGRGARLTLAGGRALTVAGVVPDGVAREAEVVAATADVPPGERRQTAAVVATRDPGAVDDAVPDDRLTRVAVLDPRPDAPGRGIVRPLAVKRRFGEFAVRLPYGDDWIEPDPAWRARAIVTRRVPILGAVTCHREFIGPLRRALVRLERQGLERLVDAGDYAGCYAPRRLVRAFEREGFTWGGRWPTAPDGMHFELHR